jgi:hypothetical protein
MSSAPQTIKLGKIYGLELSAGWPALLSSLLLWVVLAAVGMAVLQLTLLQAVIGSLLAVIFHWVSNLAHHLGHALAARRVEHPMTGVHFGFLLGRSLYPRNEADLPADIHIQRALGGPAASSQLTLVTAVLAMLLYPTGSLIFWVVLFAFFENLLVFSLGALLPLGFTDGSTILTWWRKR